MSKTQFWLGLLIGVLAALLIAAIAVLTVPRLRPLFGLDAQEIANTAVDTSSQNTTTEVTPVETTTSVETESDNIRVTSPKPNETISNPVYVTGEARVFEGVVELRLLDSDDSVLAETFTTSRAADVGLFGPFDISLAYKDAQGSVGTLQVFWTSPATGAEVDVVSIPVKFK